MGEVVGLAVVVQIVQLKLVKQRQFVLMIMRGGGGGRQRPGMSPTTASVYPQLCGEFQVRLDIGRQTNIVDEEHPPCFA